MSKKVYEYDDPGLSTIRYKKGTVKTDDRRSHLLDYRDIGEGVEK